LTRIPLHYRPIRCRPNRCGTPSQMQAAIRRRPRHSMRPAPADSTGDPLRRIACGMEDTPGDRTSCWTLPVRLQMHASHRGEMMPIPSCRRRRPANLAPSDLMGEHRSTRWRVVAKEEGSRASFRSVVAAAGWMVLPAPILRRSKMRAILSRILARNRRDDRRISARDSQESRHGDAGAKTVRDGKAEFGRMKIDRGRRKICRGREMTYRDRGPDSLAHHNCGTLVVALRIETYCGDRRR
jgi:hypothetical protein